MHFFLILIFVACGFGHPLWAADTAELARIQKDLNNKKSEENNLAKSLQKTESELADLRTALVKATREQQQSENSLLRLQTRLDKLKNQETAQRSELAKQYGGLADVLTALLRLSRTPAEVLLIKPETALDAIHGARLLRYAMPYYAEKAQKLSGQLLQIEHTRLAILDEQKSLVDAQKTFGTKQEKLGQLLSERRTWLKATASQRAETTKQIQLLSQQAQSIQDLMTKVAIATPKIKPHPKTKSGKIAFLLPAKGRKLTGYGENDEVGINSRGLTLKIKAGELIMAPADGEIVFSGPFKGYGNILILRHGDDYHSFLSGFGKMEVAVGQAVNAGEPLGNAPTENGPNPQLYYELRYKGKPIDPMNLTSKTNLASN